MTLQADFRNIIVEGDNLTIIQAAHKAQKALGIFNQSLMTSYGGI